MRITADPQPQPNPISASFIIYNYDNPQRPLADQNVTITLLNLPQGVNPQLTVSEYLDLSALRKRRSCACVRRSHRRGLAESAARVAQHGRARVSEPRAGGRAEEGVGAAAERPVLHATLADLGAVHRARQGAVYDRHHRTLVISLTELVETSCRIQQRSACNHQCLLFSFQSVCGAFAC